MTAITEKTRLNSAIREAVVANALISSGVIAAEIKQIDDRAALCETIVAMELLRIGETQESIRTAYQALNKIDTEFLYVQVSTKSANPGGYTKIDVNLCGRRVYLYANGASSGGTTTHLTEENTPHLKSVLEGGNFYPMTQVTITDQDIAARFDELEVQIAHNADKRTTVANTVAATVRKYATVGKLLEAWPDAAELLPKTFSKGTGVALSVDTLNAICGLPK